MRVSKDCAGQADSSEEEDLRQFPQRTAKDGQPQVVTSGPFPHVTACTPLHILQSDRARKCPNAQVTQQFLRAKRVQGKQARSLLGELGLGQSCWSNGLTWTVLAWLTRTTN